MNTRIHTHRKIYIHTTRVPWVVLDTLDLISGQDIDTPLNPSNFVRVDAMRGMTKLESGTCKEMYVYVYVCMIGCDAWNDELESGTCRECMCICMYACLGAIRGMTSLHAENVCVCVCMM